MRRLLGMGLCAIAAALGPRLAAADGSCAGTYYASSLAPLPAPLVVGLQVLDDSSRNLALAARFKNGLSSAGVATAGTATARMHVSVSLFGGGSGGGGGDAGGGNRSDNDADGGFAWDNGGINQQLPDETRPTFLNNAPKEPQSLYLRAELRRPGADRVAWVAVLQCTVQTDDREQLAYDLGALLGPAVGKSVGTTHF